MEFWFVILFICLFFINKNINAKFEHLNRTIDDLKNKIKYLQHTIATQATPAPSVKKEKEEIKTPEATKPEEKYIPSTIIEKPPVIPAKIVEKTKETTEEPIINTPYTAANSQKQTIPLKDSIKKEPKVYTPKKSWFESFKEKNPDLEKFIGENLINKIGILILVLGISFFVKYAIDKDWINEPARVGIGILCGALVMGIAHKLKKNYASFSSVLIAGAISIFYFTIYIAFHEYQLFSQTVAFSIITVITAFSGLVSISYNRQELAVLSLIGGFAAPFLVSTGSGNYVVFFSYIAILNIGILAISYFRKWKVVTILDFIFTTLLFSSWCIAKIGTEDFSHSGALLFATLFYFIFSITIVSNNLRNKGVFSTIEYFILVANTFSFFGIGMVILNDWESDLTGLFTLLLAIYNIIYAGILYKKFGLDKNAVYLLIGLALTFVTLTIPIQFEGNQITLFWAIEAVLLFWLSKKSKIESFKLGAIIVQLLTIISLLIDWKRYTGSEVFSVILNPVFVTGLVVSISLFITNKLLHKKDTITTRFFSLPVAVYKSIVLITTIIIAYFTGILEVNYQASQFLENNVSALSFTVTYHFISIALLLYLSKYFNNKRITKGITIVSVFSIFLYIVLFYKLPEREIIENFTKGIATNYAFYLHYIILGCLVYFGYQLFQKTNSIFNIKTKQNKWLPWLFVFAIIYVFSNELMIHGVQFSDTGNNTELMAELSDTSDNFYQKRTYIRDSIRKIQTQIIKIGYPILWGIFSFIFLIIGIKKQWKTLRVIALSLLGLTIVKLFVYDIKNASETGKIVAFILLGVLILIISFVYQKIKKLVINETPEHEDEKA